MKVSFSISGRGWRVRTRMADATHVNTTKYVFLFGTCSFESVSYGKFSWTFLVLLGFSLVSYKADVRETKKCMVNLGAYMNCPPAMNMQRNGVFDERI